MNEYATSIKLSASTGKWRVFKFVTILSQLMMIPFAGSVASREPGSPCSPPNYDGDGEAKWHSLNNGYYRCCVEITCPAGTYAVPCREGVADSTECVLCPTGPLVPHPDQSSSDGYQCTYRQCPSDQIRLFKIDNDTKKRVAVCVCDLERGYLTPPGETNPGGNYCLGPKTCPLGQELHKDGSCKHGSFKSYPRTGSCRACTENGSGLPAVGEEEMAKLIALAMTEENNIDGNGRGLCVDSIGDWQVEMAKRIALAITKAHSDIDGKGNGLPADGQADMAKPSIQAITKANDIDGKGSGSFVTSWCSPVIFATVLYALAAAIMVNRYKDYLPTTNTQQQTDNQDTTTDAYFTCTSDESQSSHDPPSSDESRCYSSTESEDIGR